MMLGIIALKQAAIAQTRSDTAVSGLLDRVTLSQKNGSLIRVRCTVIDYTGEFLKYRTQVDGRINTYAVGEVVEVTTPRTKAHREAMGHLQRLDYSRAQQLLETALSDEPREWVRRDILALLVQTALARRNFAQAGSRFLALYQSDPTTPRVDLFPLRWTQAPPTAELIAEAMRWRALDEPAAQLLAGSALLTSPAHAEDAKTRLQALCVNADRRVQRLVTTQLWRLNLAENRLGDAVLSSWEAAIDRLPKKLRGGPHYLLGDAFRRRLRYAAAAEQFLWTGLVHNANPQLAGQALVDAAWCLRETGHPAHSQSLLHEVLRKYPGSPAARAAGLQLQIENPPSSNTNSD